MSSANAICRYLWAFSIIFVNSAISISGTGCIGIPRLVFFVLLLVVSPVPPADPTAAAVGFDERGVDCTSVEPLRLGAALLKLPLQSSLSPLAVRVVAAIVIFRISSLVACVWADCDAATVPCCDSNSDDDDDDKEDFCDPS